MDVQTGFPLKQRNQVVSVNVVNGVLGKTTVHTPALDAVHRVGVRPVVIQNLKLGQLTHGQLKPHRVVRVGLDLRPSHNQHHTATKLLKDGLDDFVHGTSYTGRSCPCQQRNLGIMATLPALTDTYFTQANVPVPDVSTALVISQFEMWSIKAFLLNHLTGGTTSGTRAAGSIWTCLGSSDGVTAGLDGTDRWTTTFTPSKIVGAASGTAHSWIALREATSGYDIVIDTNSVGIGTVGLYATKSSTGLTGGSTTTRPAAAGDSEAFMCGSTLTSASTTTAVFSDFTTATPHNISFVTGTSGARWYAVGHRSGAGIAHGFLAFWNAINGDPTDTRNQWWLKSAVTGGRGSPTNTLQAGVGGARRLHNNSGPISQGGSRAWTFGGVTAGNVGIDVLRNGYFTSTIEMAGLLAGSIAHYGILTDILLTSGGSLGGSFPSVGSMNRHVLGDMVLPCGVPLVL